MTPPPSPPDNAPRRRFGTARLFALVLAIAGTIAGAEFYALHQARQARLAPPSPSVSAQPVIDGPIGAVDVPAGEALVGPRVQLSGWALDPAGIRAVELRLPDVTVNATTGIARNDVAQAKPDFRKAPTAASSSPATCRPRHRCRAPIAARSRSSPWPKTGARPCSA